MKGIPGAPGIAIGNARLIIHPDFDALISSKTQGSPEEELQRYQQGLLLTKKYFLDTGKAVSGECSSEEMEIYEGYVEILEDEDMNNEIQDMIEAGTLSAEAAVNQVYEETKKEFQMMENEYFASRAQDIAGIKKKLLTALHFGSIEHSLVLEENSVIVAIDLSPADTAQLDIKKVAAFVLEKGSKNSHVAIIARSLGLPCVFGIEQLCECFKDGTKVIVDGFEGEVIPHPGEQVLEAYLQRKEAYQRKQDALKAVLELPSQTEDRHAIKLALNASTIFEVSEKSGLSADGIGLFRTEFIFMKETDFPTAERQYGYYKDVVTAMQGKNCIFRLLDIGGDKPLHYAPYPQEANPFLGWRAIRYCFDNQAILRNQLQALVRASAHGKVSILIPMVSNLEEVLFIKKQLKKIMLQYKDEQVPFDEQLALGVMIETPSAVALAPELAEEVDFFSIGTNDLVQYTLAVDRGNPKVADLYEEFHPAVIRMISQSVKAAHEAGIWVGLCGELAANPRATPLLVGLGIDELSMNPSSIPYVKQVVRKLSFQESRKLADEVLRLGRISEIKSALEKFLALYSIEI